MTTPNTTILALGKHVTWEKLKGKLNAFMQERSGFGSLALLEVGRPMIIGGDYGLGTSKVKTIDSQEDGTIVVTTLNSTYRVTFNY